MGSSFSVKILLKCKAQHIVRTSERRQKWVIKLYDIKNKLIDNLPTAPLFDTPLFTRKLESAYQTMYDKHHKGMKPEHIYVD